MSKKKQSAKGKDEPKPQKTPRWRQNIEDEIEAVGDKVAERQKRQREKDEAK